MVDAKDIAREAGLAVPGEADDLVDIPGGKLRRSSAAAWNKMVADARAQGVLLSPGSSYRSREHQAELYAKAQKKYGSGASHWVAPPGRSTHQQGNTVDVRGPEGTVRAGSKAHQWLVANAEKYGFSQPMSWEPWHWRHWDKSTPIEARSLGRDGNQATRRGIQRQSAADIAQEAGLELPDAYRLAQEAGLKTPPQSPQDARSGVPGTSPTPNTPQQKEAAKLLSRYDAVNRKIDSLQKEIDSTKGAVFGATLGGASLPKANQLRKLKEERDALKKHPLILAKNLAGLGIQATKWSAQDIPVKSQESNVDFWKAGIDKANEAPGVLQTVRGAGEGAWNAVKSIPGAIWDQIQSVALNQARVADQMAGVPIEKQVKVPEHLEYSAQAKGLFSSVVDAIAFAGEYATPAVFFLEHKTTPEEFGGRLANAVMWGAGAKGAIEHRVAGVKKRFVEAGVPEEIVESHTPAIENIIRKEQVVSSKPPVEPTVESTGPKPLLEYTQSEWNNRGNLRDRLQKESSVALQEARNRGLDVSYDTEGDFSRLTPELRNLFQEAHNETLRVRAIENEAMLEARKFGATSTRVLDDPQFIETLRREKQRGAPSSTEPRPTSRDTTSKVSQEGGATPPASTRFSNQAKVEVTVEGKKLTPEQVDNIGKAPKTSWLDERISELESKPKKTLGKNRQRGASNIGPEEIELLVLKTARLIRDGVMTAAEVAKELGVTVGKASGLLKQADKFLRDNTHYGSYKSIEGLDPAVQNTVRRILIDSQKDVMNLKSARKRGIEEVTGMTTAELGEAAKNGLSVEQISGARHAMNELLKDPTPENVEAASKIARVVYPELTKAGRVLREVQETPEQVYSFGRLLQQADEVAKKYGQETPKAVAENLASYSNEMQSLRAELDAALEAARKERETSAGLQSKLDSMGKQKQSREYVERLRKSKDDAVARIKARLTTATAGSSPFHLLDADMVADIATVAKYYIHKGVYDITRLKARLKKEIPNASDDLILAGIDNASESASRAASPGAKQFGSYDVLARGKSGAQGPDIASMRDRLKDLRIRTASEISKMEYQMASPAKKAGIVTRGVADNVWEFFRTVKASIDNSFAGVQGWFFNMGDLILSPGAVGKNFGAGFGSFFSEAKFNKIVTDIQTHPLYNEWVADGGKLDAPGAMEMFQSHILLNEKWSKYNPFRSSDRAWQASSAQMKFNKYIEGRKAFDKMKLTDSEMRDARQALTNTIETVTGQKRFSTTDKGFNTVMSKSLFSLRNLVGQVQTLNPVYLSRLPKGTRAYMIVRAGKAYGTLAVLYGVIKGAKAAGADVDLSLDLDDKNFGMFRFGSRVFDLTGGRASIAKNSIKFFRALAQGKAPEAGRIFGSFFIQRAHPAIGAAYTVKTGKNIATGQEQGNLESITPMAIQDIIDASKENGVAVGWLLALPSFVGLNTRERLENEPKSPTDKKTAPGTETVPLPGGTNKPKSNLPDS